jgi:hypothetical protein
MSKRTPLKKGETGYAYVFLSDPGVVLKIRGSVEHYSWNGKRLHLDMKSKSISIAEYTGNRDIVYFPGVDRCRPLESFDCYFSNSGSERITMEFNGVDTANRPQVPDNFDPNASTLNLLRHLRVPPPVSIRLNWVASDYRSKQSKYSCKLECVEGDRKTSSRRQSEVDRVLDSLL